MNRDSFDSLESTIPNDVRLDTPESRERLSQLLREIETRWKSGQSSDIPWLMRASEVLLAYETNDEADARSRTLARIALLLADLTDSRLSQQIAHSSVALARRADARGALRFALTGLGILRADQLDIGGALEAYAEALHLARELDDQYGECSVWVDLGIALEYLGQYTDAFACYERGLRIALTQEPARALQGTVYTNMAQCLEYMGQLGRALEAIESAFAVTQEPRDNHTLIGRVIRESCYARLLLAANRTAEAHEHYEQARRYAQRANTDRSRMEFGVLDGIFRARSGDPEEGLKVLEALVPYLADQPAGRKQTLLAIAEANELAGRPERALASLWELTDMMRGLYQKSIPHRASHAASAYVGELNEDLSAAEQLRQRESTLRTQLAARENARAHLEMLERMAVSSGLREDSRGEAAYRIGKLANLLAAASGRDQEACGQIELAARLHDIGKAFIPDQVLLKQGALNELEREIIRSHTKEGAAFLAAAGFPETRLAEEVALYHHERWDGMGYPRKVSKEGIPWSARVVALADAFDAMTHERSYAPRSSVDDALAEIRADKGRQFDPALALRFEALINELRAAHTNLDAFLAEPASASSLLQVRARIAQALDASGGT